MKERQRKLRTLQLKRMSNRVSIFLISATLAFVVGDALTRWAL